MRGRRLDTELPISVLSTQAGPPAGALWPPYRGWALVGALVGKEKRNKTMTSQKSLGIPNYEVH